MKRSVKVEQVKRWCKRHDVGVSEHIAQTGTVYLEITAVDKQDDMECNTITVRIADHADAYCSATYTIDPAIDQSGLVKEWIEQNGDSFKHNSKAAMNRLYKSLQKQTGEYALDENGNNWYRWEWYDGKASQLHIDRIKKQIETGKAL